jgi:hypothetical protein
MAAVLGIPAGEEYRGGHFFHGEVANVAEWTTARRATVQLGLAVLTYKVAAGALREPGFNAILSGIF